MRDRYGRTINYMRLSLTDRCNLRCRYCMPAEGCPLTAHTDLLRYDELLRVAQAAASLGITRFKLTGGEPLMRRDAAAFIQALKSLPGVQQVTLTTNGLLLPPLLEPLLQAGLDAVNISLDTRDNTQYQAITRSRHTADEVLDAVRLCAGRLPAKINAVLLPETATQLIPLARLAQELPVDVRFIEPMPLGSAAAAIPPDEPCTASILERLRTVWPQLAPVHQARGNGPAQYFSAPGLQGCIGLIQAVSHGFCSRCNRVRLTCTGLLKPCLCYAEGVPLLPLLRSGISDEHLREQLRQAITHKPAAHCFPRREAITEHHNMNQIGG